MAAKKKTDVVVPIVAVIGRPNVGKSTLFNRILGRREAMVEDEPGVTRDRRYGRADWVGHVFELVDTGGLVAEMRGARRTRIQAGVLKQSEEAMREATLLVFVVDAHEGVTPEDRELAGEVRKQGKPIIWVANKVDGAKDEAAVNELYTLGREHVFGISAEHGRNVGELLDAVIELSAAPRAEEVEAAEGEEPIRVALVGRPNAGKSSLANHLLGEERMLVDAEAGTTRDAVDTAVTLRGREYVLIDTAGIRKKARVSRGTERIAVTMAEKAIERADVCVLMIDAAEGVGEQDAKIAGLCEQHGKALVIAFNKMDLLEARSSAERDKLVEDRERQLQFVPWAKAVFVSASTGKNVGKLLDAVNAAYKAFTARASTGALNRWFGGIVEKHPPSLYRGHPVKLYFIQQPQTRPPTFILSVNHPDGVHFSYRRYLTNQLREAFDLQGTPVRLVCRGRARGR